MKPWTLFLIFTWLSITALAMNILSDFWLPMLIGAATVTLLVRIALPKR
jgi:LytS/YehU family sensor histidine kinase